jgi:hypothetical protein
MKKLALERIRMPRSAGLPILFVFLIAITSNSLQASWAVLGPITADATIIDDLDDSNAAILNSCLQRTNPTTNRIQSSPRMLSRRLRLLYSPLLFGPPI